MISRSLTFFVFLGLTCLVHNVQSAAQEGGTPDKMRQEIELLRKDIELLTAKLELRDKTLEDIEKENEELREEIATLKKATPSSKQKQAKIPKKTLSDALPAATVIRGESTFVGKKLITGTFTLTIEKRDGKSFQGTYEAGPGAGLRVDVEGEINGDRIGFYSINSARRIRVLGGKKNEMLAMDFSNEIGDHYALTAKLSQ